MATTSDNLGFTLPAGDDRADIDVINKNFKIIDTDFPFKLGIDEDGNYGYYKTGADTVTPFKSGIDIEKINFRMDKHSGDSITDSISGISLTKDSGSWSWSDDDKALILDGSYYSFAVTGSYGLYEICVAINSDFTPASSSYWYSCSCILGCELSAVQKDFGIIINSSGYFAIGYDNYTIYASTIKANDGQPHTLAYAYTPYTLCFYIDGVKITTIAYTPSGTAISSLGVGWNKQGYAVKGKVYAVRVSESVLLAYGSSTTTSDYLDEVALQNYKKDLIYLNS